MARWTWLVVWHLLLITVSAQRDNECRNPTFDEFDHQMDRIEKDQTDEKQKSQNMTVKLMVNLKEVKQQLEKISKHLVKLQNEVYENAEFIKWNNPCVSLKGVRLDALQLMKFSHGSYYLKKSVDEPLSWYEMRGWCEQLAMRAPTLKSLDEVKDLAMKMLERGIKKDECVWVSASDVGRSPGYFSWADGERVEGTMWAKDEPHLFGFGNETCVWIDADVGALRDANCAKNCNHKLCELPPKLITCVSYLIK